MSLGSRLTGLRGAVTSWSHSPRGVARPLTASLLFGILATVAAWPVASLAPAVGLDPSWRFGLAQSAVHHLQWGPELDFTYGPLGFLTVRTMYFGITAGLSFAYQFLVSVALFGLLCHFTRKNVTFLLACVVSFAIGATAVALIDPGDLFMVPTFLLSVMAIRQSRPSVRRALIMVLGAISAAGLLIKFGDGIVPIALVVIVVLGSHGRPRLWDVAAGTGSFLVVLVVAWLATGNSVSALPTYLRYSAALASGYASAMQLEMGRTDEWWYALLVIVVIGTLLVHQLRHAGVQERLTSTLLVLVFVWWALKEGFVRHDSHDLIFFASMFALLVIFDLSAPQLRPVFVAIAGFLGVVTWSAAGSVPANVVTLPADVHGFGSQLHAIVSSQSRRALISSARSQMQRTYALSPAMQSELDRHTVAIEPWENSVAWAYPAIRWDPEPVLQSYAAYEANLDALDATFIDSAKAPSRILQQPPAAVDGRDPFFEPPTTFVAVLCHYAQIEHSTAWQILARVRDRCGTTRLLYSTSATFGQVVRVPRGSPDTMVVARFQSLPLTLSYRVSALVLKPAVMNLVTPSVSYRFIVGTAGDLHLMRAPASIGYAAPFMPASIPSFRLVGGGVAPHTGRFTVSFYGMRISS